MGSSAGLGAAERKVGALLADARAEPDARLEAEPCLPPDRATPRLQPRHADQRPKRAELTPGGPPAGSKRPFRPPPDGERTPKLTVRPAGLVVDTSAADRFCDSPAVPCTPANVRSMRHTPLHEKVSAGDVSGARSILEDGHSIDVQEEHGFTPLHNAATLTSAEARVSLVKLLLQFGADLHRCDNEGYSCLHWAAACGHADVIEMMIDGGADPLCKSLAGETPLHRASRLGRVECARLLMSRGGVQLARALNLRCENALDVAGKSGNRIHRALRAQIRKVILEAAPSTRALVLHHPDCSLHVTGDHHQEHPLRIDAILRHIQHHDTASRSSTREHGSPGGAASSYPTRTSPLTSAVSTRTVGFELQAYELQVNSDFPLATVEALCRVHDGKYIEMVQAAAFKLQRAPPHSPVPFTPMIQQARGAAAGSLKDPKTCDTRLSAGSYVAARRAAGAVIHAIDQVIKGEARNALCLVRPPGHHAGVNGLIPGSISCGFCVFNSVMIGAMHALHSGSAKRVAIVDFDVHHGNGTEDIIKTLLPSLPSNALFFASIHLFDTGDATFGAFYPSSGGADDIHSNIINVPIAPLWRRGMNKVAKSAGNAVSGASPRCAGCWGCGRSDWRNAMTQRILPALRSYGPDLILLSSGFDGACTDIGNSTVDAKDKYHQGLDLSSADFEWATEQAA